MMKSIVGVFDTRDHAQQVRSDLLEKGFSESDIQITASDSIDTSDTTGTVRPVRDDDESEHGISGFFHKLFGGGTHNDADEYVETYSEAVRRGSCVVTVSTDDDDEVERAEHIMKDHDAIDIDARSAQWRGEQPDTAGAAGKKLSVMKEELQVGKREVQKGGVRVFSRMTETPVEEDVQLRETHAKVERRPVDRAATEADLSAFKEGEIEVRGTAEEAVVQKTARVIEEVSVGKESTERTEKVRDSVRRTDVDVEQLPDEPTPSSGTLKRPR